MVRSPEFTREHIIGKIKVSEIPIMQSDLALTLHAGGQGKDTAVLLKQIDIRAEEVRDQAGPP